MGHHDLSHHGQDPEKIAQLKTVELEKMKALRELLDKLKKTEEQGESLLDRTMVFFSSNLGNASNHSTKNLPVLLAGGGFKHGQHLAFNEKDPMPLLQSLRDHAPAPGHRRRTLRLQHRPAPRIGKRITRALHSAEFFFHHIRFRKTSRSSGASEKSRGVIISRSRGRPPFSIWRMTCSCGRQLSSLSLRIFPSLRPVASRTAL